MTSSTFSVCRLGGTQTDPRLRLHARTGTTKRTDSTQKLQPPLDRNGAETRLFTRCRRFIAAGEETTDGSNDESLAFAAGEPPARQGRLRRMERLAGTGRADGNCEGMDPRMVRTPTFADREQPMLTLSMLQRRREAPRYERGAFGAKRPSGGTDSRRRRPAVVLCPDKDADGLSSACLLAHTFRALSHPRDLLQVSHLPRSTNNIFAPAARDGILATFADQGGPTRCVVLDQGSRPGEALVPGVDTLIIDHHLSDSFPEGATVLSACHSLPVATTSLLVYELSSTLVPALRGSGPTGLAALIGAYGDLGAGKLKFGSDDEPWPASLAPVEKKLTKSALSKSVALLNAPRRTPEFRVQDAYSALVAAAERAEVAEQTGGGGAGVSSAALKGILDDDRLQEAKERTSAETARWQGAPPVFTKDGKIAVVTVDSGYQSESRSLLLPKAQWHATVSG